jgi:hypothetical protein
VEGDVVGVLGEGGEQRLVGDDVDAARQPSGGAGDVADHARCEQVRAAIAGRLQAEREVLAHFLGAERCQREAVGDALAQLADLGLAQVVVQFGLAEKHDLQQLVLLGLQVRE